MARDRAVEANRMAEDRQTEHIRYELLLAQTRESSEQVVATREAEVKLYAQSMFELCVKSDIAACEHEAERRRSIEVDRLRADFEQKLQAQELSSSTLEGELSEAWDKALREARRSSELLGELHTAKGVYDQLARERREGSDVRVQEQKDLSLIHI